jgi:hypothetical protein
MFDELFKRHPGVGLMLGGLVFGCLLLSCLGAIGKAVGEFPDHAWGLIPGVAFGALAVAVAARFSRRPAAQRGWAFGGLLVFSLLIWFSQGVHNDGLYVSNNPGSTPVQLAAWSYAAVFGGWVAIWLLMRRTRHLRTPTVDVRAEPVAVREHRAGDRVRVLERWHYAEQRRRWWHRLFALGRVPLPSDPYLVARCACGWQGPHHELHDRSAEDLAFADARAHGTLVHPDVVYPIDQQTPA